MDASWIVADAADCWFADSNMWLRLLLLLVAECWERVHPSGQNSSHPIDTSAIFFVSASLSTWRNVRQWTLVAICCTLRTHCLVAGHPGSLSKKTCVGCTGENIQPHDVHREGNPTSVSICLLTTFSHVSYAEIYLQHVVEMYVSVI